MGELARAHGHWEGIVGEGCGEQGLERKEGPGDLGANGKGEAERGDACHQGRQEATWTQREHGQCGSTHTWSVSVIVWIGQAASVFHKKLTTHSQLKVNMGWMF